MSALAPPPAPPKVTVGDNDGARRFRIRVTQVMATLITLLVTAWLCTLGVFAAIIAIVTAKHVLVAIYLMGSGIHKTAR
jgi:hypothetical protein